MAEKSPEGASPSFTSGSTARHPSGVRTTYSTESVRTTYSTESQKTNTTAPASESNSNSAQQNLSHGTKVQTERKERMVQAESGVYITLSTLPGGGNEVKRVRFRYPNGHP